MYRWKNEIIELNGPNLLQKQRVGRVVRDVHLDRLQVGARLRQGQKLGWKCFDAEIYKQPDIDIKNSFTSLQQGGGHLQSFGFQVTILAYFVIDPLVPEMKN